MQSDPHNSGAMWEVRAPTPYAEVSPARKIAKLELMHVYNDF